MDEFHHGSGAAGLRVLIPGPNGALHPGLRLDPFQPEIHIAVVESRQLPMLLLEVSVLLSQNSAVDSHLKGQIRSHAVNVDPAEIPSGMKFLPVDEIIQSVGASDKLIGGDNGLLHLEEGCVRSHLQFEKSPSALRESQALPDGLGHCIVGSFRLICLNHHGFL